MTSGPSRRRFLTSSFAFSAAALAPGLVPAQDRPVDPAASHLLMLGDWGQRQPGDPQAAVARAMAGYQERNAIRAEAVLMLGDNWYGDLPNGADDVRWKTEFEDMYPRAAFDCPFHAVAGNHDYEMRPNSKLAAELEYARRGGTRFTMPSLWRRLEFPNRRPVLTVLALDSNIPQDGKTLESFEFVLTPDQRAQQDAWLRTELAKPRRTPFLAVMAHHALYSNKPHGDHPALIRAWDPLLRAHAVDLYLSGHHHDLQHMEFEGHPTSFVLSGGGGAHLDDVATGPEARGPFARKTHGFTHLEATPQHLILRHVDEQGQVLHVFSRDRRGRVKILS